LDSGLQRIFRKILTGDKDKNMHLFDEGNKIVRNTRPESILTTFFTTFLGFSASPVPSTPEKKI